MSESPKIFFGHNHTEEEIKDFIGQHVHKSRQERRSLLARLFGKRVDSTFYDNEGIKEATRPPSMFNK